MADWEIRSVNLEINLARLKRLPKVTGDFIEKNLRSLGGDLAGVMRRVLQVVKYRGTLANSISTEYSATPPVYQLAVGPTADHAPYVFYGTRPHWAPIEPLKEWARWKLGDERLGYAVQKSIARYGTSVYIERRGLGDGHGGYDFVTRSLQQGDAQTAITRTAERISADVVGAADNE